jgi:translation initiation factor 2B subunit (eIF-2B alpha/beta/delta family)
MAKIVIFYFSFLAQCRPLSDSMCNAIKFVKHSITHETVAMSEDDAKASLVDAIDRFVQERIVLAHVRCFFLHILFFSSARSPL